ncbi:potassium efflux system protein [Pseudoxanthomonas sp. SORGH_AS 997]|nr:potassium efflux system protein [Pseudoxanthomonas sp. SORGH_AS_0997]
MIVSFHSVSRAARRLWLLSALLVLAAGQALAQGPAAPAPSVDEALQQIDDALSTLQDQSKDEQVPENLHALGLQVADAQRQADAQALALQPQLDEIDERLKQLGDLAPGTREASDIAAERKQLQASHDRLDGAIKRAKLLSVEAQQLGDAIEKARARQLGEQLFARVASPLSPTLWRQMAQAWPDDLQRLRAVGQDLAQALQQGVATHGTAPLATGIAIALLILLPGALALRWVGQRYVIQRTPGGRLRRSALAVWTLVLGTALPTVAAWVLIDTLRAIQAIPEDLDGLADAVVRVTFFSAFVGATSAALLLPRQPSWRLLPFDDDTAVKLGRYAWLTSVAVWLSGMLTALNRVARTNPVTGVGVDGVIALVFVALVIAMLVSLLRIHRGPVEAAAEGGEAAAPAVPQRRSGVVVLISLLAQLVVAAALVGAVLGYVNFARAATQQIIWAVVVCGAGGLLMMFADDLSQWLFKPDSRFGKAASVGLGLRSSHMEQAAVLTAAVARLWLVLMVIGALLVPYGANFTSITDWIAQARKAWSASGLPLQPWDVLRAVLVALIGLALVKAAHRWLVRTYLPSTELELSTRASVAAVMRYLGITVVALCVLVTLGLDMTKLAIVASALSVGHRLRPAGDYPELHLRADPDGRAPGEDRRLGAHRRCRGRRAPHQRALHRDPGVRPLHPDRAQLGPDHQDHPQHDHGRPAGPRAAAVLGAAGHRCGRGAHAADGPVRRARERAGRAGAVGVHRFDRRRHDRHQQLRLRAQPARDLWHAQRPVLSAAAGPGRCADRAGHAAGCAHRRCGAAGDRSGARAGLSRGVDALGSIR